jgi:hypothetical protein
VAPARGSSGWAQFRRRRARGWTRSGRGASGGGWEVVGRGDLDGVEGSRRIPARKVRRRLDVGGRGEEDRGNSRKEELGSVL